MALGVQAQLETMEQELGALFWRRMLRGEADDLGDPDGHSPGHVDLPFFERNRCGTRRAHGRRKLHYDIGEEAGRSGTEASRKDLSRCDLCLGDKRHPGKTRTVPPEPGVLDPIVLKTEHVPVGRKSLMHLGHHRRKGNPKDAVRRHKQRAEMWGSCLHSVRVKLNPNTVPSHDTMPS